MKIYVGMNSYRVGLYEMNLNHFSVILHMLLHVITCVTDIEIMNDLGYYYQFNI